MIEPPQPRQGRADPPADLETGFGEAVEAGEDDA